MRGIEFLARAFLPVDRRLGDEDPPLVEERFLHFVVSRLVEVSAFGDFPQLPVDLLEAFDRRCEDPPRTGVSDLIQSEEIFPWVVGFIRRTLVSCP